MMRCLIFLALANVVSARNIEFRGYIHDPIQPPAGDFSIVEKPGKTVPFIWRIEGWSEPVRVNTDTDELPFLTNSGELAARVKIPPDAGSVRIILVRDPKPGASPPYRAVVLNATPGSFPWGSSQVVSMISAETAVQAGEHRLRLPGGKITQIPPVKKRDEFNMAQLDFYLNENGSWTPFTERRIQFVDDTRRVLLVHATPGSQHPSVTTLLEQRPQEEP